MRDRSGRADIRGGRVCLQSVRDEEVVTGSIKYESIGVSFGMFTRAIVLGLCGKFHGVRNCATVDPSKMYIRQASE